MGRGFAYLGIIGLDCQILKFIFLEIRLQDMNCVSLVIQHGADILMVFVFILKDLIDLAEASVCFAGASVQVNA
jgi:hypothetical protein